MNKVETLGEPWHKLFWTNVRSKVNSFGVAAALFVEEEWELWIICVGIRDYYCKISLIKTRLLVLNIVTNSAIYKIGGHVYSDKISQYRKMWFERLSSFKIPSTLAAWILISESDRNQPMWYISKWNIIYEMEHFCAADIYLCMEVQKI